MTLLGTRTLLVPDVGVQGFLWGAPDQVAARRKRDRFPGWGVTKPPTRRAPWWSANLFIV